jgi:ribosomal protein S4
MLIRRNSYGSLIRKFRFDICGYYLLYRRRSKWVRKHILLSYRGPRWRLKQIAERVRINQLKLRTSSKSTLRRPLQIIRQLKCFYSFVRSSCYFRYINKYKSFFLGFIERRIDVLLFRSGFARTINEARFFLIMKSVYVNEKLVTKSDFVINVFDVVSLRVSWDFLAKSIYKRILSRAFFYKHPKYLCVSYRSFEFVLLFASFDKDLFYPSLGLKKLRNFN